MARRRILLGLLLAVLAAGGLYSGYWWWSAEQMARGLERWRAEQAARGYQVHYREPEIAGFPGRLTATFRNPEVVAPAGWRWAGPTLVGSAAPWQPLRLTFRAPGRHLVVLPTVEGGRAFDIDILRAQAELELTRGGRAERLEIDLGEVTLAGAGAGEASVERVWIETGPLPPAADPEAELQARISLTGLELPAAAPTPLGGRIAHLAVEGSLHGPIRPGPPRQILELWQANNGHLLLRAIALSWGPLSFDGGGLLALDRELRPQGEINGALSGYGETIDRLQAQRLIEPGAAAGSKLVLGALARPGKQGGRPVVELPITLREGRLFLGPLALFPLPPLL